jgi:hypothetical protein
MNVSVAENVCWGVVRSGTYVHDGDGLLARRTEVLDHVLDQHGSLGDLTPCDEESVQCTARKWLGVEDIPVKLSTPHWIYALTARHLTVELEDGELAEELDGLAGCQGCCSRQPALALCDEESVQCEVQKWLGVEDIPVKLSTPRWIYALTVRHPTLDIGLTLLIGGDALAVGNDLHAELVVLDNTLDSAQVHPDVVGVEVLELLDGLELVHMLLGDLGDLEEAGLRRRGGGGGRG